jgi:RNA polymerase sigma-70 factor (ECF subfamily)
MDRELLVRATAGDQEAFEQIVLAKGEPLFRTAMAILGNEADARDATQETFVSAWRAMPWLREVDRFDAWIGRILINECRMALRRRSRVREVALPDSPDLDDTATDSPLTPSTDFDAAFNRLSVDQRAMLVLHHVHGYGIDEIAAWLGIPSGTVKWRMSRARRALAAQLDES